MSTPRDAGENVAADLPPATTGPAADGGAVTPAGAAGARASDVSRGAVVAELVGTLALLVVFGWAFLDAADWTFRTALFPRIVTAAGFLFCAGKLLQDVIGLLRHRSVGVSTPVADHPAVPSGGTHDDEADVEGDVEYLFATAGARSWSTALAWLAGFFLLLYIVGLFITAPIFSLLYLRYAGNQTWRLSTIYAVVLGAVLYLAFELALGIPTPPGLFLD
ncbi:MAG: hypothetical protein JWQ53_2975 [Klenkia sp.]|nr:hypothetical protein [Klenkia sp.]